MTDRVLLRAGSGSTPPLVMRPYELACTPGDQQLWLADRLGIPHRFVPSGITGNVISVAGRTGDITLTHNDITDWSAATAAFLSAVPVHSVAGRTGDIVLTHADITDWASVASGVASVAGRTGAVVLTHADITDWAATLAAAGYLTAIPTQPYVVSAFYPGVPGVSQVLVTHQVAQAITLPANFGTSASGAASRAGCTVNATASTVVSVDQCLAANDPTVGGNWTQIGTLTIGAGGHAATRATVGGTTKALAAGDFLRAVAPASADATAANLFLTLAADR